MLKEIREDIRKWNDILRSWVPRQYCQDTNTTQRICKFNNIPIKTSMVFVEIERSILKFTWNQGTQTVQKTLKRKLKDPHFLILKLARNQQCWNKNRTGKKTNIPTSWVEQRALRKYYLHTYGSNDLKQGCQDHQRETTVLSAMVLGKARYPHAR